MSVIQKTTELLAVGWLTFTLCMLYTCIKKDRIEGMFFMLTRSEIEKCIKSLLARYHAEYALLFGSYARGEQTPDSDVDILVVFDQENGRKVSLLRHIGIALGLQDLLGKKVDLITEGTLLPFAKETADKDKVLIYERAG